jgi:hypothetical protein
MRQLLIVSGVLGGGTALVFALAAAVATAFPTGALVPAGWNGGDVGWGRAMPAVRGPLVIDDTSGDGGVLIRPVPIGPGLGVDPNIDVLVPPDAGAPDDIVIVDN